MRITEYRTLMLEGMPSLECEITDGDIKYYANITVNTEGGEELFEQNEDSRWCYSKPMDMLGYDGNGNWKEPSADDAEKSIVHIPDEIYKEMYDFWNLNPVFTDSKEWKPYTSVKEPLCQ